MHNNLVDLVALNLLVLDFEWINDRDIAESDTDPPNVDYAGAIADVQLLLIVEGKDVRVLVTDDGVLLFLRLGLVLWVHDQP